MLRKTGVTYQPDEKNQKSVQREIEASFSSGKKTNLVNPTFADPFDSSSDGRTSPNIPDKEFIVACSKIGAFLMDKNAFVLQLRKLNQLVNKKAAENGGGLKIKALRVTLEEELGKLGFHPQLGKTFGNIPSDAFRATLANGLLLKDATLGDQAHGEFTHVIQWLMIAWQQADTHFLGSPAVDIFKRLGEEECVFEREPIFEWTDPESTRREQSIWDLIVDSFPANDFRSPPTLHDFLLENDDPELASLKVLLTARKDKRRESGAVDTLAKKYQQPSLFYHKGSLPFVHEPPKSNIDLKNFREKEEKKTPGKRS